MIWRWSGRSRKKLSKGRLKFRRPLFEGGGVGVSTCLFAGGMLSRPKAAEDIYKSICYICNVSTHSRPKAAGGAVSGFNQAGGLCKIPKIQTTEAHLLGFRLFWSVSPKTIPFLPSDYLINRQSAVIWAAVWLPSRGSGTALSNGLRRHFAQAEIVPCYSRTSGAAYGKSVRPHGVTTRLFLAPQAA